ncbi:MAG TPA: polysaccharide biosynthesis protein [Xanthomonadales bacterium]|nr:polysaccharide biosynthesis protein [Xanthomonadales bacterium]
MTHPDGATALSREPHDEHHALELRSDEALRARTRAGQSIARMAEPRTLAPVELDAMRVVRGDRDDRLHADAFREIRTRLLAHAGNRNFVTLVAPVSTGCGASFVSRNLATAFTFDEAKTALLVDCNLRHPEQQQSLGVDAPHGGLIDFLENPDIGLAAVIRPTGIPRLRLVPAGTPREMSSEYFSSSRMRALIDVLVRRYPDRYLFLDGPPIRSGPDARILSALADYVIVVAGYGRDTAASVRKAVSVFDPKKFAGVVFNELP